MKTFFIEEKFIITRELGKLCRWLRMLGFDSFFHSGSQQAEVIILSLQEKRTVVTRSQSLSFSLKTVITIKSDNVVNQLKELFAKKRLKINPEKMFSRCTLCNNVLVAVDKKELEGKVPEKVYQRKIKFTKCSNCGKIYWPGSHRKKIEEVVSLIKR